MIKTEKSLPRSQVAHFFSRMNPAGAELRTIDVVSCIRQSFDFFALSGDRGQLDDGLIEQGHRVFHTRMSALGVFRMARVMRRNRYRVVHSHLGLASGPVILVATVLRVPIRIAHFRSDAVGGKRGLRKTLYLSMSRRIIDRFATDIIGVSPESLKKGWLESWSEDSRCAVFPNGVDTADLRKKAKSSLETRPHQDENLVVTNIGRTEASKNRGRSIRIWATLAKEVPSTLYLVGELNVADRRLMYEVRDEVHVLSRIVEVGNTNNVPNFIGRAHVLLVTSSREGLPGVVLEALAVGVPVVASVLPGTEWIAAQVRGITFQSLGDSDTQWAETLVSTSQADGESIMSSFDDGPFVLKKVIPKFESLWQTG